MRRQFSCDACLKKGLTVPSKYKCPACDVHSCSLVCVNLHKVSTNCTGVRNRAQPVRKSDYNENTLISDFALLEEAARSLRAASRTRRYLPGMSPNDNFTGPDAMSKGRMTLLAREAAARNTDLRFLPKSFQRHRRNSTFARRNPPAPHSAANKSAQPSSNGKPIAVNNFVPLNSTGNSTSNQDTIPANNSTIKPPSSTNPPQSKPSEDTGATGQKHCKSNSLAPESQSERTLYWTLDVNVDADGTPIHVRVDSCCEQTLVKTLIHGALQSVRRKRGSGVGSTTGTSAWWTDGRTGEFMRGVADDDVDIFLRNEHLLAARSEVFHLPAGGQGGSEGVGADVDEGVLGMDVRKFIKVGLDMSLREALDGRCVVEFPVLHVARKGSIAAAKLEQACCGIFEKAEAVSLSSDEEVSDFEEGEIGEESEEGEVDAAVSQGEGKKSVNTKEPNGDVIETKEVVGGGDKDGDESDDSDGKESNRNHAGVKRGRDDREVNPAEAAREKSAVSGAVSGAASGGEPAQKRARVEGEVNSSSVVKSSVTSSGMTKSASPSASGAVGGGGGVGGDGGNSASLGPGSGGKTLPTATTTMEKSVPVSG